MIRTHCPNLLLKSVSEFKYCWTVISYLFDFAKLSVFILGLLGRDLPRMMSNLNMPTLELRNKSKLITMYKIINDRLDIPKDDFIPNYRTSREGYYYQPQTMIDSYKFSFSPL